MHEICRFVNALTLLSNNLVTMLQTAKLSNIMVMWSVYSVLIVNQGLFPMHRDRIGDT